VGQAAIALQTRPDLPEKLAPCCDEDTRVAVDLERAFQAQLGGGCHTALGVHMADDTLWFFHDQIGLRSLPLSEEEKSDPVGMADKTLKRMGFAV
jgi:hydroxymethylbilane synthase